MIGKHIKQYREQRDMTQEALAERLSVTRQAVSNWECGKTQPDIETLHRIADVLDISVEELIYGEKREVTVVQGKDTYPATAIGITPEGHLRVRTADGERELSSGEVSVRL